MNIYNCNNICQHIYNTINNNKKRDQSEIRKFS
jgi:hypothetical protein